MSAITAPGASLDCQLVARMPGRRSEAEIEAWVAEQDRLREARYDAHADFQRERNKGTTMERAKLKALEEVASKRPGGSLPGFLARVSDKHGMKFGRPTPEHDEAPPPPELVIATTLSVYRPPYRAPASESVHAALQAPDTLGFIVSFAGLRLFSSIAPVCSGWAARTSRGRSRTPRRTACSRT